mmetsp:Transcript_20244/g.52519  ORF Transcript_20244/g.52519 Transcript_20244/m.52519 type:complete len:207 (+) Transcript_20244:2577-3197(+)
MAPFSHDPPWIGSEKWLMLITHTKMQITMMALQSESPNSSSLILSGVFLFLSSSSSAVWILPISVLSAVPITTPTAFPPATLVPEKQTLCLPWSITFSSSMGSICLVTETVSPVRIDWSTRRLIDLSSIMRRSAGILSPVRIITMSPGTRSTALISPKFGLAARRTIALAGANSLRALMASAADCSCHTPTNAFAIKITRITSGST